jgi:hypothetical protein
MTYEELFKEKAASGYTVCCVDTSNIRTSHFENYSRNTSKIIE